MRIFISLLFFVFFGFFNITFFLFFCFLLFFLIVILFEFQVINYIFNYELISWSLILLTSFIFLLIILRNLSFSFDFFDGKDFNIYLSFLFISLVVLFSSSRIFLFYIFFEFSIIPIFFLLCG
jgi:NADH:ubiquinone oxidoreductase subunit 4 (subunit M)